MSLNMSIEDLVREALAHLRHRAALLGGPPDITDVFNEPGGLSDYPRLAGDPEASYDRGWIEGAAAALDMTVLELLDEFGLA